MSYIKAVRDAVPMLIGMSGPSGSGKTYTALLIAKGIAGPKGIVGFLDAENGRGKMYVDSPGIAKAYPDSYLYERIDAPFHPERYTEKIVEAEKAGVNVLVIDSTSHEWEGIGGCTDIAEQYANKRTGEPDWKRAKKLHKRFMLHNLSTPMHLIFCLRAQEKVKYVPDPEKPGKNKIVPIGFQPICEKSFMFEMLLSFMLEPDTHAAKPVKVPEPLAHLFTGNRVLTIEDGQRIREWNEEGRQIDPIEHLRKRARVAAEDGMKAYSAFFAALTPAQKRSLADTDHEANKEIADKADAERAYAEQQQNTAAEQEEEPLFTSAG